MSCGDAGPGERCGGAAGKRVEGGDVEIAACIQRTGAGEILLDVRHAIAIGIGMRVHAGVAEILQLPSDGQAVGIEQTRRNRVGLDKGHGIAETDPAAVGAPDGTGELARAQIKRRRPGVFKIDPPDVRAVGVAAQVAKPVIVHAKIVGSVILVLDAIDRRTAPEADPADVSRINVAGANILTDNRTIGTVTGPIQPANVRAVGVFIDRIDGGGGPAQSKGTDDRNTCQECFQRIDVFQGL